MKKKYYFYIFLILLIAFVAYNYYSAAQAEENITQLIQEQVDKSRESISIQFSSIDVSPFQGNIEFKDVNIIQSKVIRRTKHLTLDLSYYDFLKFNIGGIKYGLKHLSEALIILKNPSYVNRQTRAEINFKQLTINYEGKMWSGIQAYFTSKPLPESQTVKITGAKATYWKPKSSFGTFKVDSLNLQHTFTGVKRQKTDSVNTLYLKTISWNPPKGFKQKYSFFIRGMGLNTDSLSIQKVSFSYLNKQTKLKISNGVFKAPLLSADFYGMIDKQPRLTFSPLNFTVTNLSSRLEGVLQGVKQLFNIPIPLTRGAIQFKLIGPITDPQLTFDTKTQSTL